MQLPQALDFSLEHGLRLRVWDHGASDQGEVGTKAKLPTVLFVHGYLDTGRSFDDAIRFLAPEVRCLCLDWRGHGQSEAAGTGGSYHLLDHLKDLSQLIDQMADNSNKALSAPDLIVAHSMGGNVALLLAGARPHVVPRLLLLDALGPPAEEATEQPARLGRLLESLGPARAFKTFVDRQAAQARVRETNGGLSEAGAERMVRHALVEVANGFSFAFDPRLKGPVPMRYPESFWQALCSQITARTLVLRSAYGYVPEGEPARSRVDAMAAGTTITVPDVGHHLHVELPELLARHVRDLLRTPLSATSARR